MSEICPLDQSLLSIYRCRCVSPSYSCSSVGDQKLAPSTLNSLFESSYQSLVACQQKRRRKIGESRNSYRIIINSYVWICVVVFCQLFRQPFFWWSARFAD